LLLIDGLMIEAPKYPVFASGDYCLIAQGDCRDILRTLPDESFQMCVTSPPYWGLRDYGVDGQIGAEQDPEGYVEHLVQVFREVKRVLKPDGTLWLNLGDSYTSGDRTWRQADKKNPARGMRYRPRTPQGLKPKDLVGIPWRVAFALQADGWYLRSDIIWAKPNCQPESVRDRPTKSHEYLFLMSKSQNYLYDRDGIAEETVNGGTRNRRTVWPINTEAYAGAHFAVFPPSLVRPCVSAGSRPGSWVLDPFFGSGTVGQVCIEMHRKCLGIELKAEYVNLARTRLGSTANTLF